MPSAPARPSCGACRHAPKTEGFPMLSLARLFSGAELLCGQLGLLPRGGNV